LGSKSAYGVSVFTMIISVYNVGGLSLTDFSHNK
jgi:hypothetical protein